MAAILSGANLNFHTLRYVSERCEIGENREALLAVTMPEQPGSFFKICLCHRQPCSNRIQLSLCR